MYGNRSFTGNLPHEKEEQQKISNIDQKPLVGHFFSDSPSSTTSNDLHQKKPPQNITRPQTPSNPSPDKPEILTQMPTLVQNNPGFRALDNFTPPKNSGELAPNLRKHLSSHKGPVPRWFEQRISNNTSNFNSVLNEQISTPHNASLESSISSKKSDYQSLSKELPPFSTLTTSSNSFHLKPIDEANSIMLKNTKIETVNPASSIIMSQISTLTHDGPGQDTLSAETSSTPIYGSVFPHISSSDFLYKNSREHLSQFNDQNLPASASKLAESATECPRCSTKVLTLDAHFCSCCGLKLMKSNVNANFPVKNMHGFLKNDLVSQDSDMQLSLKEHRQIPDKSSITEENNNSSLAMSPEIDEHSASKVNFHKLTHHNTLNDVSRFEIPNNETIEIKKSISTANSSIKFNTTRASPEKIDAFESLTSSSNQRTNIEYDFFSNSNLENTQSTNHSPNPTANLSNGEDTNDFSDHFSNENPSSCCTEQSPVENHFNYKSVFEPSHRKDFDYVEKSRDMNENNNSGQKNEQVFDTEPTFEHQNNLSYLNQHENFEEIGDPRKTQIFDQFSKLSVNTESVSTIEPEIALEDYIPPINYPSISNNLKEKNQVSEELSVKSIEGSQQNAIATPQSNIQDISFFFNSENTKASQENYLSSDLNRKISDQPPKLSEHGTLNTLASINQVNELGLVHFETSKDSHFSGNQNSFIPDSNELNANNSTKLEHFHPSTDRHDLSNDSLREIKNQFFATDPPKTIENFEPATLTTEISNVHQTMNYSTHQHVPVQETFDSVRNVNYSHVDTPINFNNNYSQFDSDIAQPGQDSFSNASKNVGNQSFHSNQTSESNNQFEFSVHSSLALENRQLDANQFGHLDSKTDVSFNTTTPNHIINQSDQDFNQYNHDYTLMHQKPDHYNYHNLNFSAVSYPNSSNLVGQANNLPVQQEFHPYTNQENNQYLDISPEYKIEDNFNQTSQLKVHELNQQAHEHHQQITSSYEFSPTTHPESGSEVSFKFKAPESFNQSHVQYGQTIQSSPHVSQSSFDQNFNLAPAVDHYHPRNQLHTMDNEFLHTNSLNQVNVNYYRENKPSVKNQPENRIHPIFCFAPGGILYTSFPVQQTRYSGDPSTGSTSTIFYRPGTIKSTSLKSIFEKTDSGLAYIKSVTSVSKGLPLIPIDRFTKSKDLMIDPSEFTSRTDDEKLIIKTVACIAQTKNPLTTNYSSLPSCPEYAEILGKLDLELIHSNDNSDYPRFITETTKLVSAGQIKTAIDHAKRNRRWSHSMILTSIVSESHVNDVSSMYETIHSFCQAELPKGHPLRCFYMMNSIEGIFEHGSNASPNFRNILSMEIEDLVNLPGNYSIWLISMLLSVNHIKNVPKLVFLGDILIANGKYPSGHLCYLLSGNPEIILNRIEILGLNPNISKFVENIGNYSMMRLTEVLELCLLLSLPNKVEDGQKKYMRLMRLQKAKTRHAEIMFDLGLVEVSVGYCHALIELLNAPEFNSSAMGLINRLNSLHDLMINSGWGNIASLSNSSTSHQQSWLLPKIMPFNGIMEAFDRGLTKVIGFDESDSPKAINNFNNSSESETKSAASSARRFSVKTEEELQRLSGTKTNLNDASDNTTNNFNGEVNASSNFSAGQPVHTPMSSFTSTQPIIYPHTQFLAGSHGGHTDFSTNFSNESFSSQGSFPTQAYQQKDEIATTLLSGHSHDPNHQHIQSFYDQSHIQQYPANPQDTLNHQNYTHDYSHHYTQAGHNHSYKTSEFEHGNPNQAHLHQLHNTSMAGQDHQTNPQFSHHYQPENISTSQNLPSFDTPHANFEYQHQNMQSFVHGYHSPPQGYMQSTEIQSSASNLVMFEQPQTITAKPTDTQIIQNHSSVPSNDAEMLDYGFGNKKLDEPKKSSPSHEAQSTVNNSHFSSEKSKDKDSTKIPSASDDTKPATRTGPIGYLSSWIGWGNNSQSRSGPKSGMGTSSNASTESLSGGPTKANLGEPSSFYYDENLKRWIDKKDPNPEVSALPPPPPMTAASSTSANPGAVVGTFQDLSQKNGENLPQISGNDPHIYRHRVNKENSVRSRYIDPFKNTEQSAPPNLKVLAPTIPGTFSHQTMTSHVPGMIFNSGSELQKSSNPNTMMPQSSYSANVSPQIVTTRTEVFSDQAKLAHHQTFNHQFEPNYSNQNIIHQPPAAQQLGSTAFAPIAHPPGHFYNSGGGNYVHQDPQLQQSPHVTLQHRNQHMHGSYQQGTGPLPEYSGMNQSQFAQNHPHYQ